MTRAYDTSDPKEVEREQRRVNVLTRQNRDDLKAVLSSRQGRRWVSRLLEATRVLQSVWDPSSRIHWLAGRQDLGNEILRGILELDPNIYLDMLKESKEEQSHG